MWYWLCSGESVMKCVRFYIFLSFFECACLLLFFACIFCFFPRCYVLSASFASFPSSFCRFLYSWHFSSHFTRATHFAHHSFHCYCWCSSNSMYVIVVGVAIGSFVHTYQLIMQLNHSLQFILVSFFSIHFLSLSQSLPFLLRLHQNDAVFGT